MITPQSQLLLRLHGHYKHHILPYAGGILEQPHYYAEAMEIISAREAHMQAEELERLRKESGVRA